MHLVTRRAHDHGNMTMVMTRTIPAGEFKAKCLQLMDEVQRTGEEIIITKRGKPVARLRAAAPPRQTIFGRMKGTITYMGDVISPTGVEWDANRD